MDLLKNKLYSAAHFALELDGAGDIGVFRSIEGGNAKSDVMTYQHGQGYDRWRQLGKAKFEDLRLQVGMSMSEPFYEWIEKFFKGETVRKNGAVIAADFHYKERARREFQQALIKELVFPKLDGSDRNAAYMTVGIAVEEISFKTGDGKKLAPAKGMDTQKLWSACNFAFTLEGFEASCKRVSKIDSFTVKQNVVEHHTGGMRAPIKVATQVDFPNLTFYIPEADAGKFFEHYTRRGIGGSTPAAAALHGSIQTFDPAGGLLFTLHYYGADIIAVTPDKSDAASEEIKQVKIELCTERMEFDYVPRVATPTLPI